MKISNKLIGPLFFSVLIALFLMMSGAFTEKLPTEPIRNSFKETYSGSDSDGVAKQGTAEFEAFELKAITQLSYREFTGTVIAKQQASLSARLTAKVSEVLVDVGESVKAGEILMRLENADLAAKLKQAQQALSAADAQRSALRKEYRRSKELLQKKLVPQSQFDQVESQLKSAQAIFMQAQAAVSEAHTQFDFSIITAPFNGVITQRNINLGDTASPNMTLLQLYNPTELQLRVDISESVINHVRLGAKMDFELPTFNVQGVGHVQEIAPAADTTSRSYIVKVGLNEELAIYPGSYGKVRLVTGSQTELFLPEEALYQVGELDYVKVLEKGELSTRLVQLGAMNRVRKGVKQGEVVVLYPLGKRE